MRSMAKRPCVWPYWVGGVVLLLGCLFFCYRDNRNYACDLCSSYQSRNQWRFGMWMGPSLPLSADSITERVSHFSRDYLQPGHSHRWVFAQGSPYGLLSGWGG